jgi:hypothetical protein
MAVGPGLAEPPQLEAHVDSEQKPWTNLAVNNPPENFQFAVVTDRTGGHRDGVFLEGVHKLNLLQPEFVVSVGDLIEGYTEDLGRLDREWQEFNGFVAKLEMPFFYVPGNHDISNPVMTRDWLRRYGKSYYHFRFQDVLFLCLNSEDPPSSQISDDQVAYVKAALEENQDVRWTLVFIHKPLWSYNGENGWNKVAALLADRDYTAFAGHTHRYFEHFENDKQHLTLATMGGGSRLRGDNFGEFDHFAWITMTDEGPITAILQLDGIWDTHIMNSERAGLIRPLLRGAAVRNEGIVVDGGTFEGAQTRVRLTNDADLPMEVEVRFLQDDILRSDRQRVTRVVDPNSVEDVTLELFTEIPVDPATLRPLRAEWRAEYNVQDNVNPVVVEGTHRIVVDTTFPLMARTEPVAVDGNLGEWGALTVLPAEPGQVETTQDAWYGNQDASVQFGVYHDADYIYIAAKVTDDNRYLRPDDDYNDQDGIEIYLDARPAANRSGGVTFKDFLMLGLAAGQSTDKLHKRDSLPEGTQIASETTDQGYTVEAAIPLTYIEQQGGANWADLRVNIAVRDYDPDGTAMIWWRPDWRSPADYAGSGVFTRE